MEEQITYAKALALARLYGTRFPRRGEAAQLTFSQRIENRAGCVWRVWAEVFTD